MTTHTMLYIGMHPGDLAEWYCEKCGRHFLMDRDGRKTILQAGDLTANHTGGTGGLVIGDVTAIDSRLEPFEKWMQEHGEG